MGPSIAGFRIIAELYVGSRTSVYRALRERDGQAVVLKTVPREHASARSSAKLRHEFDVASTLTSPLIIRPLQLLQENSSAVLVLEDFEAVPLAAVLQVRRLTLLECLHVTAAVGRALEHVHKCRIIHKDVKPSNILVSEDLSRVKLVDFSISSMLPEETQSLTSPHLLEGSLPYMSPEQTGRMNRPLDWRTDLYSLGVSMYEMLTGSRPFTPSDPLQLVYHHIASLPAPPLSKDPSIPPIVSDICLKLLAKDATKRYQTAAGLCDDLERCLLELQAAGRIEPFILGTTDVSERLLIPSYLLGREAELNRLLQTYARAVETKSTQLVLVGGYSGIGKSTLVAELQRQVTTQGANFASGKFDQYRRNVPYAAIVGALRGLFRQLLSMSREAAAAWKVCVRDALGGNGSLMTDQIPELLHLIGPQPPVPALGATEATNRWLKVFSSLVRTLATQEAPLCLFLDDLQWADPPTLKLLEVLLSEGDSCSLLLVGAYRSNELDRSPALQQFLTTLTNDTLPLTQLELGPLSEEHTALFVEQALAMGCAKTGQLSELVYQKTYGNPFFVIQLLKSLVASNVLVFDREASSWTWDLARLRAAPGTENVVAFMSEQLKLLPQGTLEVLRSAAAIGDLFDLHMLSCVVEQPAQQVERALWPAIEQGYLRPEGPNYSLPNDQGQEPASSDRRKYCFAHDRIRQAAYLENDEAARTRIHLKTGSLMLTGVSEAAMDEVLFTALYHLNLAHALIVDPSERQRLAKLNLRSGLRAKDSAAVDSALSFLHACLHLLGENGWSTEPQMMFEVRHAEAECEMLDGRPEKALELVRALRSHVSETSWQENGRLRVLELTALGCLGRMREGVEQGLAGLQAFGVNFPLDDEGIRTAAAQEREFVDAWLAEHGIEALLMLPKLTDAKVKALLSVLEKVIPAVYSAMPKLFPLVTTLIMRLVIKHGTTPGCALAYLLYGLLVDDWEVTCALGEAAVSHNKQENSRALFAAIQFGYGCLILHWDRPISVSVRCLKEAVEVGVENGDYIYASYNESRAIVHRFFGGENLDRLLADIPKSEALVAKLGSPVNVGTMRQMRQVIKALKGQTMAAGCLTGDGFDEKAHEQSMRGLLSNSNLYWTLKQMVCYMLGQYKDSLAAAKSAAAYAEGGKGAIWVLEHMVFRGLAAAAVLPDASALDRSELATWLEEAEKAARGWAKQAPLNHKHKAALLAAERLRLAGDVRGARAEYDEAISAAEAAGFQHYVAMANQRAASCRKGAVARGFLAEAHASYAEWGAIAVLQVLEEGAQSGRYWDQSLTTTRTLHSTSHTSGSGSDMDLQAVMDSSQALSSEIHLSKLLQKLLSVVMETAGARHVAVALARGNSEALHLEAVCNIAEGEGEQIATAKLEPKPLEKAAEVPITLITYVFRTRELVLLDRGELINSNSGAAITLRDSYLSKKRPCSLLCMPIVHHDKAIGVLYVENDIASNAFPSSRAKVLTLLSSQLAISIMNSYNYERMEEQVAARTEELTAAKEAAEAATKAKSLFLAMMSHEIRTPLNAVVGMISLLVETELTAEQRDMLETVRSSSDALLTLINDILDFSKVESGSLVFENMPFDVRGCMEETLDLMLPKAAAKGLELALWVDPDVPTYILGDPARLRQILVNLCSNAVKFTDSGGEVFASARVESVSEDGDGEYVLSFSIRDTGIGIPADRIHLLFQQFSQCDPSTTRKYGGTGLGLAISQRLCQQMGGSFTVDSTVGVGSTFTFNIVAKAALYPQNSSHPKPATPEDGEENPLLGKRLLIVDANETNRMIAVRYAESWAMLPRPCATSGSTLAALEAARQPFDLAMFAVRMGGPPLEEVGGTSDGLSLAAAARRLWPNLPTVLLQEPLCSPSRNGEPRDLIERVADSTVAKPLKAALLYHALTTALEARMEAGTQGGRNGSLGGLDETSQRDDEGGGLDDQTGVVMDGPVRILLAEDNVVNQKVALMMLRRLGREATCVEDGVECLRELEKRPYDVVLLDVHMPRLDGLQVAARVQKHFPADRRPHLVAITANAMAGDRDVCLAAGMDDYISKPMALADLQVMLDKILAKRIQRRLNDHDFKPPKLLGCGPGRLRSKSAGPGRTASMSSTSSVDEPQEEKL